MSAFCAAVQAFADSLPDGSPPEVTARLDAAIQASADLSADEASWVVLGLVERLSDEQTRYPALIACLIERAMSAGGDAWAATGLMVERTHDALIRAGRFADTCAARLRAAGMAESDESAAADALRLDVARAIPADAVAFTELDLWCHVASGLLSCFAEARTLFRSLGGTPALLGRFVEAREGVAALLRELEAHPVDAPSSAPDAAEVVANLPESADAEAEPGSATQELYLALFCVAQATRDAVLTGLGERIARCDVAWLGELAQVAGGLVEIGGDPRRAADAFVARLPGVLEAAGRFVTACGSAARVLGRDGDDGDPAELVERFGRAVARQMPAEAAAWQALEPLCIGAVAHLARLPALRQRLRHEETLVPLADALAPTSGAATCLAKVLHVLDDEELVVLAPDLERGWRIRIGGIADNAQLHTLLAGALVGPPDEGFCPGPVGTVGADGEQPPEPGRPLDRLAVGAARDLPVGLDEPGISSHLQLWNWPALQPDGRLPDDVMRRTDDFIWNEGVPADILPFEGTRIVLLGPAPYARSWNGGRLVQGMPARLDVVAALDAAAVQQWLGRLAAAPRP